MNIMLRELSNDLSVIENKIKNLRVIINLPIVQNRDLSDSEKKKVKTLINDIIVLLQKYLEML